MQFSVRILPTLLWIVCITSAAHSQQEFRFAFLELPPLGGSHSFGRAINESGTVVGAAFIPGNTYRPVAWLDGDPLDLGTLGAEGEAWGINSSGWIVGRSFVPEGNRGWHAFLWRDGRIEDIGTLGGYPSQAWAINNFGHIVGDSRNVLGTVEAFIWRDGKMDSLLAFDPQLNSFAYGLDNEGQMVGKSFKRFGQFNTERAALWQSNEIIDLGTHRSDNMGRGQAREINDLGYIVGWADDETSRSKAFIWLEGRMYNIHTLGLYSQSFAYAINNLGQVVGFHSTDESFWRGFLWEQGRGMQLLTDLVPPSCRWRPMVASDINDAGQIAGYGTPKAAPDSIYRAFIMSPVNPTITLAAPSPGRAGEVNTLTVSNCTPGATVQFLYSRFGGGTRIPGCDLQQNALQLDSPTVIGTAIADANGVASITRTVPPVVRNQTILFQAVVQNECAISQLVVHQFE